MLIEYVMTKHRRQVSDSIGRRLVKSRIAREVYETRALEPEGAPQSSEAEVEISQRTGKPKRTYRRRDLRAED